MHGIPRFAREGREHAFGFWFRLVLLLVELSEEIAFASTRRGGLALVELSKKIASAFFGAWLVGLLLLVVGLVWFKLLEIVGHLRSAQGLSGGALTIEGVKLAAQTWVRTQCLDSCGWRLCAGSWGSCRLGCAWLSHFL